MSDLFIQTYNPDVLSCIANLSNDEVFTPPEVANQMLDLLPEELWRDSSATFLDPGCKSGVFLREIARRLIRGLEDAYPDLEVRLNHIFREQLYGFATTELTSLMSRRSIYCSKYPNSKYSITPFDNAEGNLRFRNVQHTWSAGRCKHCGASRIEYDRDPSLEQYAYEFIHLHSSEEAPAMKFDVIIGNPPYQMSDGGNGASASPVYHKFVEQSIKLNPRYLVMITPSRWFAGGKGLDSFRDKMLNDRRTRKMVDFINAKDCFPQNSVSGGVNYFLWDRDHGGDCELTTVLGDRRDTQLRRLNEFPIFVRFNSAVDIIHKVRGYEGFTSLVDRISSRNPFGLPTSTRGEIQKKSGDYLLISSKGESYIGPDKVEKGSKLAKQYKVMISRITYEHAGEPDKEGKLRVLSKVQVLGPDEVCTDSYLVAGPFDSKEEANNFAGFLKTKFARFLISQALSSINLSKDRFCFVPEIPWNEPVDDRLLYSRFGLSAENVDFIESLIHPIVSDKVSIDVD